MRNGDKLLLFAAHLALLGIAFKANVAQEPPAYTPITLSPVPAIDGEDPAIRQMQWDQWRKQPSTLKVQGAVVDASGKPLPNTKLLLTPYLGVHLEGMSDANGKFQFEISGVGLHSIYFESADGKLAGASETTRPSEGENIDLKVTLFPTKEVTLTILDEKGEPISGANCGAFLRQCVFARGKSNAEGKVTFRVPPTLPPTPPERRDRTAAFYVFAAGYGVAVGPAPSVDGVIGETLELKLSKADPLKVNTVDRDQKRLSGIPVAMMGLQVMIPGPRSAPPTGFGGGFAVANAYINEPIPFEMDIRSYVKSDETGTATLNWFSIPVSAEAAARIPIGAAATAPVRIVAFHESWGANSVDFNTATRPLEATCTLFSPSKIRGRVRLPNGEPAPGIVIRPPRADATSKTITTGDNGEFEFTAMHNNYELVVDDPKWVADMIFVRSLVEKSAENEIEIELRAGKRVSFQMTAGTDYEPLANHTIELSGSRFRRTIRTDERGVAETVLDRGLYTIHPDIGDALARQNTTRFGWGELRVLVKDQDSISVPLHFERSKPRRVEITVMKSDGKTPAENAKVTIFNPYTEVTVEDRAGAAFASSRTARGGRPVPEAAGGPIGGRGGFPPSGFGASGRSPDGTLFTREVTLESVQTDSAGKAAVLVADEAAAILMVSGVNGEKTVAKVDVLDDTSNIRLAKTVSAKGKLLDETSGAPIAGQEVFAQIDSSELLPEFRRMPRGAVDPSSILRVKAVTDAEGRFEFNELIADCKYVLQPTLPRTTAGGALPGEIRAAVAQLSVRNFQTAKEGDKDLGEIRARVYTPRSPRPRNPNDPNLQ